MKSFFFKPKNYFLKLCQTDFSSKLSLTPSLSKIVILILPNMIPDRKPAFCHAFTLLPTMVQQVFCYRTPSEHLEEGNNQRAKGGIPALHWANHPGKLDMPVLPGRA
jgi:hypothetical protein